MTVDVRELVVLAHDLSAGPGRVGAKVSVAMRKGAKDVERDMKILAAVDTGALEGSISSDVEGDGRTGTMSFEVGPTVEYGPEVEYGTEPHVILPKNGEFLVFMINGNKVFVRKVNHPGTRAQPYAGPSFDRNLPGIINAIGDAGEQVL